jgi:hypothetical protein
MIARRHLDRQTKRQSIRLRIDVLFFPCIIFLCSEFLCSMRVRTYLSLPHQKTDFVAWLAHLRTRVKDEFRKGQWNSDVGGKTKRG